MLDIRFIRENKDLVTAAAKKKRIKFDVEELITADDKRRTLMTSTEKKRAEQNAASEKITKVATPEERAALIAAMKIVKADLEKEETEFKDVMVKWQNLMERTILPSTSRVAAAPPAV